MRAMKVAAFLVVVAAVALGFLYDMRIQQGQQQNVPAAPNSAAVNQQTTQQATQQPAANPEPSAPVSVPVQQPAGDPVWFFAYRTNPEPINEALAKNLSRFDLVVLDFDAYFANPAAVTRIKELNPRVKLLMYFNPMEFFDPSYRGEDGQPCGSGAYNCRPRLRQLFEQVRRDRPQYWLRALPDQPVHYWLEPPMRMLNLSVCGPVVEGRRWCDFVSEWHLSNTLNDPVWDGIFMDNTWENISWVPESKGLRFDLNSDGQPDNSSELDVGWAAGVRLILQAIRARKGPAFIIIGNKPNLDFAFSDGDGSRLCSGKMSENFPDPCFQANWSVNAFHLRYLRRNGLTHNLVLSHGLGSGTDQSRRFGLASAMLFDAGYGFKQDSSRWFPEFDQAQALGQPVSPARGPLTLIFYEYFDSQRWETVFNGRQKPDARLARFEGENWLLVEGERELCLPPLPPGQYIVSFRHRLMDSSRTQLVLESRTSPGVSQQIARWDRWPSSACFQRVELTAQASLVIKAAGAGASVLIDDLEVHQVGPSQLWSREYQNGWVLCNPTREEIVCQEGPYGTRVPPQDGVFVRRP